MSQPIKHIKNSSTRFHLRLSVLLALWVIEGCAGAPQPPQNFPLPPPEEASSLAAQLILDGNRLFAEHRWTAAIGKYEEATHAQPKLAEAHYNLGMALYRKGPVSAASPHFIEAANLAPGHPVIGNAPPFRKYDTDDTVKPDILPLEPNDHFDYQH